MLLDLLVEWEERKAAGTPVTPEELCRAYPEWVEELRRHVAGIARIDPLLAMAGGPVPTTVPGFEMLEELGRGGMGTVYKARDLTLNRTVALKIPFQAGTSVVLRKRFEREAQTLAKLRHPNIVPVHSAGLTGDTPYLVLEYVPGGSLAERMREVAGKPAQVAALLAKVALAVGHAHAVGIVHRDLKPSNILLDEQGQPLVSDFGVAALLAGESVAGPAEDTPDDRHPTHTRLTRTGAVAGTPAYAAPEQYDPARFGPIRPATDIWAMGVILYELLTARRPFTGTTWGELREQVCSGVVPPAPVVGRRLRQVVARCLAKDPAVRFRTARELADALTATSSRPGWWVAGVIASALALAGIYQLVPRPEPTAPTWPDVPVVREETDRLSRGDVSELISPGKQPAACGWVTGTGSGRVISQSGEDFRIVSLSPVGCLVELLPALPPGRYRIDAEVQHETGNGMSWVGVYTCASHCEIRRGRQHFMLMARFSDRGGTAVEKPNNNSVMANRRTHLLAQYIGDSDTDLMAGTALPASSQNNRLVPAPPLGYRRLSLTIGRNAVAATQADDEVGVMNFTEVGQAFAEAHQKYPDLPASGWSVRPHGGIGLYVLNGSLAVRSFRVTPLPIEE